MANVWSDTPPEQEAEKPKPKQVWSDKPPEKPSPAQIVLKDVGDKVSGAYTAAKDFLTGDSSREFDYPELPDFWMPGAEAKRVAGDVFHSRAHAGGSSKSRMSLGRDDPRKLDILNSTAGLKFPAAPDKFGNIVVDVGPEVGEKFGIEPKKYYLNRPGLSAQDLDDILTTGSIEALTMFNRLTGPLMRLPGMWGVTAAGGGASGGAVVQDLAASAAGSEQGVDMQAALIAGLLGSGSEAAGRMLVPAFKKMFSSSAITPDGQISDAAQQVLREAGIEPDSVTREWMHRFNEAARVDADAASAARYADANALPTRVPLSTGDQTRDVIQQGFESSAEKGSHGAAAREPMAAFRATQQAALKENADKIGKMVGTGDDLTPGQGIAQTQDRLAGEASSLYKAGQEGYERATAANARVSADGIKSFVDEQRSTLQKAFGQADNAKAYELLGELESSLDSGGGARVSKITLNRVEEFRQALSKAQRAAGRDPSGVVLRRTKNALDEFLDGAVERGVLTGDVDALAEFKSARSIWNRLKQKYDGDGVADMLIEFDPEAGKYIPKGTPEEASTTLFNASGVGFKRGATKAASQLKELLGADSSEWAALKQEVFMRLLRSQDTGNVRGQDLELLFSGDKFSTQLRTAMRQSEELMRTFFSPGEINLFRQFERAALLATNRVPGAVNHSNSGEMLARLAGRLGEVFPGVKYILQPLMSASARAVDERAVRSAVTGAASNAARDYSLSRAARGVPGLAGGLLAPNITEERPRQPR